MILDDFGDFYHLHAVVFKDLPSKISSCWGAVGRVSIRAGKQELVTYLDLAEDLIRHDFLGSSV